VLLLAHALNTSKEKIIFNPSRILTNDELASFDDLIELRFKRKSVAQIIGKKEFYGRDFLVNEHVLTPRPDSETLIESVMETFSNREKEFKILEIGIGSGCLLISLLKIYKNAVGIGIDISAEALAVASQNTIQHEVATRATLRQIDFAEFEVGEFDLVISNPPYIETSEIEKLEPEVKDREPRIALDGGGDGLDFYRLIASKIKFPTIVEIGFEQEKSVEEIFLSQGFKLLKSKKDLSGIVRVLAFAKIGSQ
jgi:release factor glutamine methyltransferase